MAVMFVLKRHTLCFLVSYIGKNQACDQVDNSGMPSIVLSFRILSPLYFYLRKFSTRSSRVYLAREMLDMFVQLFEYLFNIPHATRYC